MKTKNRRNKTSFKTSSKNSEVLDQELPKQRYKASWGHTNYQLSRELDRNSIAEVAFFNQEC